MAQTPETRTGHATATGSESAASRESRVRSRGPSEPSSRQNTPDSQARSSDSPVPTPSELFRERSRQRLGSNPPASSTASSSTSVRPQQSGSNSPASSRGSSSTSVRSQQSDGRLEVVEPPAADQADADIPWETRLKMVACATGLLMGGFHNGATGALMPFLAETFGGSTKLPSLIFSMTAAASLVAGVSNLRLSTSYRTSALLLAGSGLQCLAYLLLVWERPVWVLLPAYFACATAITCETINGNSFVFSRTRNAKWLAVMHAGSSFGSMVSPSIATAIARRAGLNRFYVLTLVLSCAQTAFLVRAFRDDVRAPRRPAPASHPDARQGDRGTMLAQVRELAAMRVVQAFMAFLVLYFAADSTASGWATEFLQQRRRGGAWAGYAAGTAYYAGGLACRLLAYRLTGSRWQRSEVCIVLCACGTAFAGSMLLLTVPLAPLDVVFLCALGFAAGSIIPFSLSLSGRVVETITAPARVPPITAALFSIENTVGACLGASFSLLLGHVDLKWYPPVLLAWTGLMMLVWVVIPRPDIAPARRRRQHYNYSEVLRGLRFALGVLEDRAGISDHEV